MNFAWSFRPIFIWFFAMVGVNLDESKAKTRLGMYLSIFISLFWILCLKIPLYSLRIYNGIIFDDPGNTSRVFIINNNIKLDHKRSSVYDSPDNDNLFLLLVVETVLEKIAWAGRCHRRRRRILSPIAMGSLRWIDTYFHGISTVFFYEIVLLKIETNILENIWTDLIENET